MIRTHLTDRRVGSGGADLEPVRTPRAWEKIALWGVIAAGFALRIEGLHDIGLSADEAQFVYIAANGSWQTAWHTIVEQSPHPPANFALIHLLLKASWNPLWLRLPSVLAGTFLIWMAHRFGRSLFGPAAALAFAVLVAFSPGLLELSRACRNYSLGFAFLLPAVHFLVRYIENRQRRPLIAFAVLAPATGVWHYGFVVAFIALTVVVAIEFLLQRRPLRDWIAVAVAHLPFALTMGALYWLHVSKMPSQLVDIHQSIYASGLGLTMLDSLGSLLRVWRYLEFSPFTEIFAVLSIVGVAGLLFRRRRLALLVCAIPPIVALGFSASGLMPLGGTRNSAYLFPFIFGLVAFVIGEVAMGLRPATAGAVNDAVPHRTSSAWGTTAAIALGLWFAGASIVDRAADQRYTPVIRNGQPIELNAGYRLADIERGFALIEREVNENDLVVLNFQGLYAMRMHYHLRPPSKMRRRLPVWSKNVRTFAWNGVTYHSSNTSGLTSPEELLTIVDRVLAAKRLPEPKRVWTVQGGGEFLLANQMRRRFPGVPFDASVERESGGNVFAIATADLRTALAAKGARAPRRGKRAKQ